jgi:hypothetical protein
LDNPPSIPPKLATTIPPNSAKKGIPFHLPFLIIATVLEGRKWFVKMVVKDPQL